MRGVPAHTDSKSSSYAEAEHQCMKDTISGKCGGHSTAAGWEQRN